MVRDIGVCTSLGGLDDLVAVDAHVGGVCVSEQTDDARFLGQKPFAKFVLEIFGMNLPGLPHQIDAVGNLGHQTFGETESPISVFKVEDRAYCVSASIGSVVPCTVIVGGPIDELKMRVGTDRIDVDKIGHAELAEAKFEPSPWKFVKQRQKIAFVLHFVFAQRKNIMEYAAAKIRRLAK